MWLTSVHEREGEVTLVGGAVDHGDVAEVARRLESSAHFREMKLVSQERKFDVALGVTYIEFTIRGDMVYLLEPYKPAGAAPEAPPAAAADADASAGDGAAAAADSDDAAVKLKSALLPQPDAAAGETGAATADADVEPVDSREEKDYGPPPPIVPKPVAPPPAPEPSRAPSVAPLLQEAVEPPPADQAADPGDPGAATAPSAPPAPAGSENP